MNRNRYLMLKRVFDVFLSMIAILVLSPLLVIVAVFVKLDSRGPAFYKQKRLGKDKKVFTLLKFRSMINKKRTTHHQIFKSNHEVTKVGHFIRRYKIDELPQLFNILKGDMSFIGPRPCLVSLEDKFDENGMFRAQVKPGLSGLAQINGNIHLSWPERWVYDRYYVENLSFCLDLKIFLRTFSIVILGEQKFLKK